MSLYGWIVGEKEEDNVSEISEQQHIDFSSFWMVTDYIYEKSGITELDKRALTSSRLQTYATENEIYTTNDFLAKMKNDTSFYQDVINIATVNETFFLREIKELEWLVEYVKEQDRALKILSMPSSSGEEIYSILLLLSEAGVDLSNISIRGYDINSNAIAHAKSGEFEEHSLHKLNFAMKQKYFTKLQDHYKISQTFINKAEFFQKNIFEIIGESNSYDIVLSRNMFIYFDKEKQKEATDIIVNILKDGGVFIKGHADSIYEHPDLKSLKYGVYKKEKGDKV